ncbi:MAG: hypothetical protein AB7P03_15080 [Kofleriaceae bacterium]
MKIFGALLITALVACTGRAVVTSGPSSPHTHRTTRSEPPPPPPHHHEPPPPPPPHDHRPPPPPPPPMANWVELAPPQRNDDNRDFIELKNRGQYRRLKFEVRRGVLVLKQILVQFDKDERKDIKVRVDQRITAGSPPIEIDLPGVTRSIGRIVIYTDSKDRGIYKVYGLQ